MIVDFTPFYTHLWTTIKKRRKKLWFCVIAFLWSTIYGHIQFSFDWVKLTKNKIDVPGNFGMGSSGDFWFLFCGGDGLYCQARHMPGGILRFNHWLDIAVFVCHSEWCPLQYFENHKCFQWVEFCDVIFCDVHTRMYAHTHTLDLISYSLSCSNVNK